jgi:hypothetical protein
MALSGEDALLLRYLWADRQTGEDRSEDPAISTEEERARSSMIA